MSSASLAGRRATLIRLIHVAKRELQLDDDTYRTLLRTASGGLASTADMSERQLQAVLEQAKKAGFAVRSSKPEGQGRRLDRSPEARKVRALWLFLHQLGAVRDPSETALAHYCRRIAGVDDLHWASHQQLARLTETLKKWAMRPAVLPQTLVTLHDAVLAQSDLAAQAERLQALKQAAECLQRGQGFDAHLAAWRCLRRALECADLPELQPLHND